MKEIVFLNKNADYWKSSEKFLDTDKSEQPDLIADAYIKITDDLAFARTYFHGTETEKYLNWLAAKFHSKIYKTKKEDKQKFLNFWKTEFPKLVFDIRKQILYSFAVFAVAVTLGVASANNDIDFVRLILGDNYVNMTIENIKNGDPMAVYKVTDGTDMFFAIAKNNFKVMLLVFVSGIFTPLATAMLITRNGIMVGAFQYFFYKYNLLTVSASAIWLHGTVEMFTLIVSGAAGIMLGQALLFPGTFSRINSLIKAGRKGAKIIAGISIFVFAAAFIESYFTRHTEWPYFIKYGIIIASLAFIVLYFFVYPAFLNKNKSNKLSF